jgi:hypothetical protein
VGLIAEAGGDFKFVSVFVVTVDSVIIGSIGVVVSSSWANAAVDKTNRNSIVNFFIPLPKLVN